MIFSNKRIIIGFLFLMTLSFSVRTFSQIFTPVTWSFQQKKISDTETELIFIASIERSWHLYSQFIPAEDGPEPTSFNFETSKDYQLEGRVAEPKPTEEYDPNFKMNLKFFSGKTVFRQKIKMLSEKPFQVKGYVHFMSCDNSKCTPPEDIDFVFNLPGISAKTGEKVIQGKEISAIPITSDSISRIQKPLPSAASPLQSTEAIKGETSLWGVIIEAILWGFAALLTPCVFPMVPMTVSFFMKGNKNKRKGRVMASIYGISIITLYTLPIAAIIFITYIIGGQSITADIFNWLSTHWLPNILFFLIFMVFAASFLGAFEIVMPSSLVNKADAKADKGGLIGTFFMALTLVLVSFSCTGPIVGTIIVKSTRGEIWEPIVTMLAFSTAFALPFTLFAFFPSWLSNLPKSGGWLNAVKVVLGFLELALGLKFLSVADQTYHWGILDREVYLAIWIVVFTLLGFYLLGKLKFSHDSETKHLSVPRTLLAIVTFAFVMYMIPGMFGAPLKALSGYLPPQTSLDFDLVRIVQENKGGGTVSSTESELCETPKFSEFLHLPHGLKGYFDYDQALACAKKQNKPLFIDFTGHGCVNCREMEANVWSAPEVLKRLRNNFIVVALYVDDKSELPESEWITSKYDGKIKKTIGKKFADLQISRFNMNAQPYYVLLDTKGELLVTPRAYNLDVNEFVKFLDNGIAEFKKRQ
ncbi:MAG: thioredoxin family protein [Lentimicrobiaceae bacterium]|nr:thioredoxin family protein [Lentimicrobiaceae bacterium]